MSHPTRGAWIEINSLGIRNRGVKSHPTMGAWIEILLTPSSKIANSVAPHDGCVD